MDRRNKRNEATETKKDTKVKDRGDLKKVNDRIIKKSDENTQVDMSVAYLERGDSERKETTNQKPEKTRINVVHKKLTNDEAKFKSVHDGDNVASKKNSDKDTEKHQCDIELRKRIRDKYTLKLKSHAIKNVHSNSNVNKKDDNSKTVPVKSDANKTVDRPKKQLVEDTTQTKDMYTSTSTGIEPNNDKKPDRNGTKPDKNSGKPDRNSVKPERNQSRRKPMIKTIMSKNGSVRIYKAVTFVDQKQTPTSIEIKIPSDSSCKKQKVSKFTDTSSLKFKPKPAVSRASIKEKPVGVRRKLDRKRDRKRHVSSPSYSIADHSPPTEVARWAPCCIDRHTKPYYEAWVNTTLAAIYKSSKKDKLFIEKQRESILQSLQRSLNERPETPELFYENMADEKYTGRIKITQR